MIEQRVDDCGGHVANGSSFEAVPAATPVGGPVALHPAGRLGELAERYLDDDGDLVGVEEIGQL